MGDFDSDYSLIHRLDPRTKLILVVAITLMCTIINNIFLLLSIGAGLIILLTFSKTLKRVSALLGFFLIFAAAAISLTAIITRDINYALEYFSPFLARFFIIICAGLLFAFTTPPQRFAQSLQQMRIPTSITFTLGITLRYIPTLAREAESIFQSLKLRGIHLSKWDYIRRPSMIYRGIIIPLIIRSIKLSDEIAIAAESRAFKSNKSRSSLKKLTIGKNDVLFLGIMIITMGLVFYLDNNPVFPF
ncbi:energy-coupling factor transporter transmembrane protein EcfT [Methanobacterium alkalithermotolerans]|uniref:Energy-coupling factor transporter transmembrane protein EcfT n=1 Tax=Methanobacterium alkalithermotolerans TaxID=2731220 RepID=A0A8T8K3H2_9EURY|nr:energy-coupling factor transporter transmembrane component T [Methanobacterium alkalithermotolerans]QUH22459.1 energy-coupling factor transporter transmembrane protein EcfT [Methanobacterium alkalithermotolerans]